MKKDTFDVRLDNLDALRRTTGLYLNLAARMGEIAQGADCPLKREARAAYRAFHVAERDCDEARALRERQRFAAASRALRLKEQEASR